MGAPDLRQRVIREIESRGLLLVTDPVLPSVTGLVTGEPVKGSWWSHPKGREIYAVLSSLEEEDGLLLVKLVAKKETFVHRLLWPELFAVALAREEWQTKGLDARARGLLEKVEAAGTLRLDEIGRGFDRKELARAARQLEERLLAQGSQVHTETGAHQKLLSSFAHRARALGIATPRLDPAAARGVLEGRTTGKLPWHRR